MKMMEPQQLAYREPLQDVNGRCLGRGAPDGQDVSPKYGAPAVASPNHHPMAAGSPILNRGSMSPTRPEVDEARYDYVVKNTFLHVEGGEGQSSPGCQRRTSSQPAKKSPGIASDTSDFDGHYAQADVGCHNSSNSNMSNTISNNNHLGGAVGLTGSTVGGAGGMAGAVVGGGGMELLERPVGCGGAHIPLVPFCLPSYSAQNNLESSIGSNIYHEGASESSDVEPETDQAVGRPETNARALLGGGESVGRFSRHDRAGNRGRGLSGTWSQRSTATSQATSEANGSLHRAGCGMTGTDSTETSQSKGKDSVRPSLQDVFGNSAGKSGIPNQSWSRGNTTAVEASSGGSPATNSSAAPPRAGARWWIQSDELCALSGFPLKLLPYPPFKFQVGKKNAADGWVLVDGQCLLLKILSEWNFEILGRKMTQANVEALDEYMKRCKLGSWRLTPAIDACSRAMKGDAQAKHDWEQRKSSAAAKLQKLQEIQRARQGKLRRGSRGDLLAEVSSPIRCARDLQSTSSSMMQTNSCCSPEDPHTLETPEKPASRTFGRAPGSFMASAGKTVTTPGSPDKSHRMRLQEDPFSQEQRPSPLPAQQHQQPQLPLLQQQQNVNNQMGSMPVSGCTHQYMNSAPLQQAFQQQQQQQLQQPQQQQVFLPNQQQQQQQQQLQQQQQQLNQYSLPNQSPPQRCMSNQDSFNMPGMCLTPMGCPQTQVQQQPQQQIFQHQQCSPQQCHNQHAYLPQMQPLQQPLQQQSQQLPQMQHSLSFVSSSSASSSPSSSPVLRHQHQQHFAGQSPSQNPNIFDPASGRPASFMALSPGTTAPMAQIFVPINMA